METLTQKLLNDLQRLNQAQLEFKNALSTFRNSKLQKYTDFEKENREKIIYTINKFLVISGLEPEYVYLFFNQDKYQRVIDLSDKVIASLELFGYLDEEKKYVTNLNEVKNKYEQYVGTVDNIIETLIKMGYQKDEIHIGGIGFESLVKYTTKGYLTSYKEISPQYRMQDLFEEHNPLFNYDANCQYKVVIGDVILLGLNLRDVKFEIFDIITSNFLMVGCDTDEQSFKSPRIIGKSYIVWNSNVNKSDCIYVGSDLGSASSDAPSNKYNLTSDDIQRLGVGSSAKECDLANLALNKAIETIIKDNNRNN